jgi:hypothetical protein
MPEPFDRDAVIQVLESERGRDISPIVRSAARWAVEVTEGDGIWWCERHQCRWGYHPNCGWSPRGEACPKSRRLLIEWEAK